MRKGWSDGGTRTSHLRRRSKVPGASCHVRGKRGLRSRAWQCAKHVQLSSKAIGAGRVIPVSSRLVSFAGCQTARCVRTSRTTYARPAVLPGCMKPATRALDGSSSKGPHSGSRLASMVDEDSEHSASPYDLVAAPCATVAVGLEHQSTPAISCRGAREGSPSAGRRPSTTALNCRDPIPARLALVRESAPRTEEGGGQVPVQP